jgi:elongation factor G
MHVPEPVLSLALSNPDSKMDAVFSRALAKFQREDPTFRVTEDPDSKETIISGMGELHLEIYVERMRREYKLSPVTKKPQVAFRETVEARGDFEYTHKKQTGGRGQYAKIAGYIEPLEEGDGESGVSSRNEFDNQILGNTIPPEYIAGIEKGFKEALLKGPFTGNPVVGTRMAVVDGGYHPVDSSEMAFRICTMNAFREGMKKADPVLLEPIMDVEVTCPTEFQGAIVGQISRRKGIIISSFNDINTFVLRAEVPLNNMFGYSTDLRSATQGKGEYSMEYKLHRRVTKDLQNELIENYQKQRQAAIKK